MLKLRKVGQFGHIFTRNMETVVQTVEQRTHKGADKTAKMWKNLCMFVAAPAVIFSSIRNYLKKQEEKHHIRKEFIHYPYLKIMNKPFPWGDGKHSLFHNPKTNYIPGIGYEE